LFWFCLTQWGATWWTSSSNAKIIAKFTNLLLKETDPAKRELLQKLLTDEMVRQASPSDTNNKS